MKINNIYTDPYYQHKVANKLSGKYVTSVRIWIRRSLAYYARSIRGSQLESVPRLNEILLKIGQEIIFKIYVTGIKVTENEKPEAKQFQIRDKELEKYLQNLSAERISLIDEVTREQIRQAMHDALVAGEGWQGAVRRIQEISNSTIPDYRAERIARTEIHTGMSIGLYKNAQDLGFTHKRWVAVLDARTRPAHAVANGQIVQIKEKFNVGGELLAFPHDPHGSAHNVVNCRCTLTFLDKSDETSIDEEPTIPPQNTPELKTSHVKKIRNDYVKSNIPPLPRSSDYDELAFYARNDLGVKVSDYDKFMYGGKITEESQNKSKNIKKLLQTIRDIKIRFPNAIKNVRYSINPNTKIHNVAGFSTIPDSRIGNSDVFLSYYDNEYDKKVNLFWDIASWDEKIFERTINQISKRNPVLFFSIKPYVFAKIVLQAIGDAKVDWFKNERLNELYSDFTASMIVYHELGHAIDFSNIIRPYFEKYPDLKSKVWQIRKLSKYAKTNDKETIAEFLALVFAPGGIKTGLKDLDDAIDFFRQEFGYQEYSDSESAKFIKKLINTIKEIER